MWVNADGSKTITGTIHLPAKCFIPWGIVLVVVRLASH
jgi:hypothetical protein